ncbi:phosphotriesterase-related protein isoform X2 [Haliaeetus albicilla]|uniref:phosphotriesterase-related protein isoform X2 n=1 Tax=Haliaeetus leucocephalus TaxID=52644 RepID=UPI0005226AA3|nr:PREDICTED: phosphotriesterase-related protein isoform X2 [Haliaeetus albicilla]XP_010574505.1 PREDICTED: phosphotriesterase-related protein isoform X2 [Haliaeetus leucocephalus]
MPFLRGKAQTVLGPVEPDCLGYTLTHEHLTMNYSGCYCPPSPGQEHLSDAPIEMKNLFWIKQNPYSHKENLLLYQETDAVKEELLHFKAAGGGTIVENTTTGIGRDMNTLKKLAEETGVHIIAGAGFYVDSTHSSQTQAMTVEQFTGIIVDEILNGADGTNIKCGVVGEIGCSWPLTQSEHRVLQATAQAQSQLGCPVIIHPGRNSGAPFQIIRILQEAGADISKTVMSHLDRIRMLIDEGYEDRILIAHDVHTKNRLMKYGGHGYSHILKNIVPKMLIRGISQDKIDKILLANPKRWLTFK